MRSKSKGTVKVGSLEDKHGHTIFESQKKAEILNEFFWSVFNKEDTSQIPSLIHVLISAVQIY